MNGRLSLNERSVQAAGSVAMPSRSTDGRAAVRRMSNRETGDTRGMPREPGPPAAKGVTLAQGTALYLGAVLGTGVIALPALAARAAGPASLLAWLGMVLLSVPLAATFAALGARYPDAGGVSTYARRAFGARAAAVVGWCFYASAPVGAPAAALFAGSYVAAAAGGGRVTEMTTAVAVLAVVVVTNLFGVRVSGRIQLLLAALLLALLAAAVGSALPAVRWSNLHPFAPHGWAGIARAAALLVWSFVGWEAITNLAAEFRQPRRDLPRAAALALVIIGVSYLALAAVTILVLGPAAGTAQAPLASLLARGLGGPTRAIAAVAAVILTLGVLNPYWAGAAKLGAALGRDGAMPAWLSRGSQAGEVPRRSLLTLAGLTLAAVWVVGLTGVDTSPLLLATNGLLLTVYAIGTAAAIRLLPSRGVGRAASAAGFVITLGLLAAVGAYLAVAAVITGTALAYLSWRSRRKTRVAAGGQDAAGRARAARPD